MAYRHQYRQFSGLSRAYAAAATAALANFDSLVLEPLAEGTKDVQKAKQIISQRDPLFWWFLSP
ncbi:MAG: hypothetical protein JO271_18290 [Verrucomicrobia bacterium]|nr:hypothetical protein [Verrucomicrobiota bacterium]